MMNKKISVLLSVLLTLTMLFSSVVPVFATGDSAQAAPVAPTGDGEPAPVAEPNAPVDDPALNVLARTLALKENVYVKYAVPANGETVKMLFWTAEQTEYTAENAALVVEASYQQNVNGTMCNIFQYTGMLDHQMTDVLYARAYVENGNRYGEVTKYSILQYAYNKKNAEEPDAALTATLDVLLNKGAAAQTEQNYKTDDLANEPHSTVHVVDDVLSDGFKEMLHPDSKPITGIESYLLLSGAYTYFIEHGIQMLGYHLIESYIYYFDEGTGAKKSVDYDGHLFDKVGRIFADSEFVTLSNGNTYYLVEQIVVYRFYVINNYVYYFGEDGVMQKGTTAPGGYTVNAEGIVIADNAFIDCGEYVYYIRGNMVVYIYVYIDGVLNLKLGDQYYPTRNYENVIRESDNDENPENNDKLAGVTCKAYIEELDMEFTVTSDENGRFVFPNLPMFEVKLVFVIIGYIEVTIYVDLSDGSTSETAPEIVLDRNVSNTLSGRVTIADSDMNFSNNNSLAGATVTIDRISSTNSFTATTTTDYNGNYSFGDLTAGVYKLVVVIEGYIVVNQIVYVRHNETNIQNTPIEAIPSGDMSAGTAQGTIVDARTGEAVSGLTVYVRAGINNITGEILQTVTTNASGLYEILDMLPGNYTAQIVDERTLASEDDRFGTTVIAIKILGGEIIGNQGTAISNNAGFDINGMRVVLTWGSSPSDLDSHMTYTPQGSSSTQHIYYGYKNYYGSNGHEISLDVDDTSSYGPETVTVSNIQNGVYTYYIHNFSGGSSALANSGATIKIYLGGSTTPTYTLYVPSGYGLYWNVFTYNSVTGEFTITNTIS